nr:porin [uncultured Cupriavidus sp.]
MKKGLSFFAILVASAPAAWAQSSVTLYGVADAGLEYLTHTNAAGNSLARVTSGTMSGSRWGLRGTEDLGGGLRAVFALESGFELDTGVSSQGGRLFGRQALVGLENQWGRLTFGRQQNAFYDLLINYDPMVLGGKYSAQLVEPNFVGRYDNSVKYAGKFGPVSTVAVYSAARGTSLSTGGFASEVPGDPQSDRAFSAGVEYATGPFGVVAIFEQQDGTAGVAGQNSSQRDRRFATAANAAFGNSNVYVGYRWLNGGIAAPKRSDVYWLGYRYQLLPALALTAAGYYFNDKDSARDPWAAVASANYVFSKRTDAFLTVGYVKNKAGSNLGLNGFGNTIGTGQNQTGVSMSIRHKF